MVDFDEFTADIYKTPVPAFTEMAQDCGLEVAPEQSTNEDRDLWCVCEIPEGETPRVKAFVQLSDFLKFVKAREGTDTFVWLFYGKPLVLSKPYHCADKTKQRFVRIPGHKWVSTQDGSAAETDSPELELTGWLGNISSETYFQQGFKDE